MNIKELRIGNKVLAMGRLETTIDYIYGDENLIGSTNFAERGIEDFEPLPITEQALIKLGFTKDNNGFYHGSINGLSLSEPIDVKINGYTLCMADRIVYGAKRIKYVHQIQNILTDLL